MNGGIPEWKLPSVVICIVKGWIIPVILVLGVNIKNIKAWDQKTLTLVLDPQVNSWNGPTNTPKHRRWAELRSKSGPEA